MRVYFDTDYSVQLADDFADLHNDYIFLGQFGEKGVVCWVFVAADAARFLAIVAKEVRSFGVSASPYQMFNELGSTAVSVTCEMIGFVPKGRPPQDVSMLLSEATTSSSLSMWLTSGHHYWMTAESYDLVAAENPSSSRNHVELLLIDIGDIGVSKALSKYGFGSDVSGSALSPSSLDS
jgi:hypothetical protein